MEDFELLATLQHHGDKTNLIDFTTDYLVALFFACDGKLGEPGRLILLQKQSEAYEAEKPPRTIRRAEIQKSIFIQAPKGFVEPDKVVCVPADLKAPMLDYLRKHHDLSTKTIYNDLQGFIENRGLHKSAYTEFYKGVTCQDHGDSAKTQEEKLDWYDDAIAHYTEAVGLKPDLANGYNSRGIVYGEKGDFDAAIEDFNTAIDLDPKGASAYTNRGIAYDGKDDFDAAIQDYNTAIDLNPEIAAAYYNRGFTYLMEDKVVAAIQDFNTSIDLDPKNEDAYVACFIACLLLIDPREAKDDLTTAKNKDVDIVALFHNRYESIEDFEAKNGVKLPEDIAALLRGNGT